MNQVVSHDETPRFVDSGQDIDLTDESHIIDLTDRQTDLEAQQLGLNRRPTALASNMLGIRYLAPAVFGDKQDLRADAIAMELDRGEQGFSPNAVRELYDEEGRLSLEALRKLVTNYFTWDGRRIK